MNICIVRNAQIEKNASMTRVLDAVTPNFNAFVITRDRDVKGGDKLTEKQFTFNDKSIQNYQINIKADRGGGIGNLQNLFFYQLALFKTLVKSRKDIDVVHSFDLDAGLPSRIFAKLYKKKHVYHIADFYVDSRGGIPQKIRNIIGKVEFNIINSADAVIICTEDRKKQIEGSTPKWLSVIHNTPVSFSVDADNMVDPIDPFMDVPIKICYIGALTEKRFIKELIGAVKGNADVHLIIGGMGALQDWVRDEAEVADNITFLGEVDYRDTINYYYYCNLMVAIYDPKVKNHQYSAPNKVYEAIELGKPLIAAKNSGMNHIVGENDMGFLIDYSQEDFDKVLQELIDNPEILINKGENSRSLQKYYSWSKMKERLSKVYENLQWL